MYSCLYSDWPRCGFGVYPYSVDLLCCEVYLVPTLEVLFLLSCLPGAKIAELFEATIVCRLLMALIFSFFPDELRLNFLSKLKVSFFPEL